jgi:5-carboxymethyl-2-hydroxymuconate isomerase
LHLGNLHISKSSTINLSTTPQLINILSNAGTIVDYVVSNAAGVRSGTIRIANYNASQTALEDEYVETDVSVNANLTSNSTHIIASVSSGDALFKYNFKRFI